MASLADELQFENPTLPPVLSMAPAPPPTANMGEAFATATSYDNGLTDDGGALSRYAAANYKSTMYDGYAAGRQSSITDAADNRIKDIEIATGEKIGNPYRDGFMDEALGVREREAPGDVTKGFVSPNADYGRLKELQINAFQQKLADLAGKYPDKVDAIGVNRPLVEDAKELANYWQREAGQAREAIHGTVAPFLVQFGSGLAASWRDPIQAVALVVGGPELAAIKAARYGGPILARMIGDGLLNAGISAIGQPEVQAWRQERGQENGVMPALQDVGMNFLFGAAIGGAVGGVKMAIHPSQVELVNRAMSGDMTAAREVATVLTKEHAPDLHAYLDTDHLDATATSDPLPAHTASADLERSYQQSIRRLEDPNEPLPEMPPVADRRYTDVAARKALEDTPHQSSLETLRSDVGLIHSALVSDDPNLQRAGRVASMGDEAFDMVRRGEVDPMVAAEVASRVSDHAEQASVLREVMAERPQSPAQAARIVSDSMERRALPDSLRQLLGTDGARDATFTPEDHASLIAPVERDLGLTQEPTVGRAKGKPKPSKDEGEESFLNTVPIADREDASDVRMMSREDLAATQPREHWLADVVDRCSA